MKCSALTVISATVFTLLLSGPALAGQPEAPETPAASAAPHPPQHLVVEGGNAFGLALYGHLAGGSKGNLFLSPTSIHTALAMTYAGARGDTAEQMYRTLQFPMDTKLQAGKPDAGPQELEQRRVPWPQDRLHTAFAGLIEALNKPRMVPEWTGRQRVEKPAYELTVCNALWGQEGFPFREEFIKRVGTSYGAGLRNVDFVKATEASRKRINDWVARQTKDKIRDLIPPGVLDATTRLVLTNAIYFKSNWASKFEKSATRDEAFRLGGGKSVTTAMMHQQKRFGYVETASLQALEMPYRAGDLSMVVLLPREPDGLAALEKSLTLRHLDEWLGKLRPAEVRVSFPRFKFTSQFGLGETLAAMGMPDAFSAAKADFSAMTTADRLFISAVIHKAFVAVDEEGTEAAAATAVAMALTAIAPQPPKPKIFNADHPFIFLIRHRQTGAILFVGRAANPKA